MKVIIGSNQEGFTLKELIKNKLIAEGYDVIDKTPEAAIDFVDSTLAIGTEVLATTDSLGIAVDGYGVGSFITATKMKGMIAASVSDERSAYMTCEHNNARMITLGEKIIGSELAFNIVSQFLNSSYEGGRHQIRVDMLNKMG